VVPVTYHLRGWVGTEFILFISNNFFSLFCDFLWSKPKNLKGSNETAWQFLDFCKLNYFFGHKKTG
jgi:hypothetical protein